VHPYVFLKITFNDMVIYVLSLDDFTRGQKYGYRSNFGKFVIN